MTDTPSSIERGGIRVTRRPADDGDEVTCSKTGGNGALGPLTLGQAHELLDSLAMLLNRPDLISAHRHRPEKRTQPGMYQPPSKEHRNYDH
jgi:hypothetical protein